MSERDPVLSWLDKAASRIRTNERLEEGARLVIVLCILIIVHQMLRTTLSSTVMAALLPLFVMATAMMMLLFAWRLFGRDLLQPPDRALAAAAVDARAGLHNELQSACWFSGRARPDDFVKLHLVRAAQTSRRLDVSRLLPVVMPGNLSVAVALMVFAAVVVWMPDSGNAFAPVGADGATAMAQRGAAAGAATDEPSDDAFDGDEFIGKSAEAVWLRVENLARELRAGPDTAQLAQAIAARDARTASRLLARLDRSEVAQPAAAASASPQTEQMSEQLAKGIVERLQSLLSEGGGWSGQGAANRDAAATERLTDELTRELREEMAGAQPSRPGEMSPQEQVLNTTLEAMSRDSTGGREVIRGEANPMPGLGRTTVGSGAMGRRIGVSTAGAGDGEQPQGDPEGDAEAQPVLGKKTLRLQLQMQTVKIDQPQSQDEDGSEESFYAATQAQAAKTQYETVTAGQRGGAEQSARVGELPLAYREAAKEYTVRQHRREVLSDQ